VRPARPGQVVSVREHLLPHDAGSRDVSSAERTREQLLRDLGLKGLRVLPNASVATGIEQVRLRFWPHAYCALSSWPVGTGLKQHHASIHLFGQARRERRPS
jgi:hypothetical protein